MGMIALSAALNTGCNDSFLDKKPSTSITEVNAFESYVTIKSYMWPCFEMLTNTTIATSPNNFGANSTYLGDWNAGYISNKNNNMNDFAFQEKTGASSGNGWSFSYIYRINIMLRALENSTLSESEKNHWKAIGYFFHSFWYMELIDRFGDVPWIDKVLDESSEETYGPRSPRKEVADKVLERLKWAEQNIGNFEDKDGKNYINKACIQMALSRFTLREGTWRKYHNLGDYEKYLTECTRVSKELMDKYPTLYTGTDGQPAAGYGEMWTTQDLGNIPGVILYKEFKTDYVTSYFNFREKNDQMHLQLTQDMVDMYLTKNGLPIENSENTQYDGHTKDIYDIFRNRDPRMYHTVTPPYVVVNSSTRPDARPEGYPNCKWSYHENEKYREYMNIMGINGPCSNPGEPGAMKRLPVTNWNGATVIWKAPNLKGAVAPCCTSSGYYLWKNYNCWELSNNNAAVCDSDKPIFKVEEAILNYAEAMCELGLFDQAAADISINRLRTRAEVSSMDVSKIDANFDPNRDKGNNAWWTGSMPDYPVDPLLWEIRRERIIELMGEGFGFYDVRRWAKAPYFINRQEKGMWWNSKDPIYNINTNGILNTETGLKDATMTEGYIYVNPNAKVEGKGWLDQYYLYCIPTEELALNPQLEQNPGWPGAK